MYSPKLPATMAILLTAACLLTLSSCQYSSSTPAMALEKHEMPAGRQLAQMPRPAKQKPVSRKKKIYLTFDDGPNHGTRNVMDIVKEENVPVSFFIVGEHVFASKAQAQLWDSLRSMPNVEICNHSFTHAHNRYDKFYANPATVVNDMRRTQELLLPQTSIVRAPGRNSWRIENIRITDIRKSAAAMDSLQQAGFLVLGWDLEWHYNPVTFQVKNSAEELMSQVDSLFKKGKTRVPGNLVLLAHDQVYRRSEDSVQLRNFIQLLKSRDDYELSLVSTYPAIAGRKTESKVQQLPVPAVAAPVDSSQPRRYDSIPVETQSDTSALRDTQKQKEKAGW